MFFTSSHAFSRKRKNCLFNLKKRKKIKYILSTTESQFVSLILLLVFEDLISIYVAFTFLALRCKITFSDFFHLKWAFNYLPYTGNISTKLNFLRVFVLKLQALQMWQTGRGTDATDRQKLQAFLNRSKRSGFCDSEIDDFATLCSTADTQLFNRILKQPEHVLHSLLPPSSASQYNLRHRPHNRLLCQRASRLTDCNFIIRMLYSDMYWLTLRTFYCFVFVSHVEVRFDISVIKELIDWLIDWTD